jgi:hypothetical protein
MAKEIWNDNYNEKLLHNLHTIKGKEMVKRGMFKKEPLEKTYYLYEVLNFYLDSFEEWSEDERANCLEYFVFNLKKIEINEQDIYNIVIKNFMEFA